MSTKAGLHFERQKVTSFLSKYCCNLVTDDVLQNDSFVSAFSKSVDKLSEFKSLENLYLANMQQRSKSKFSNELSDISREIDSLFEIMKETGGIKLNVSLGTSNLSVLAMKKNTLLIEVLTKSLNILSSMKDKNILKTLRKRREQQDGVHLSAHKEFTTSDILVRCRNSKMSWVQAYNLFSYQAADLNKVANQTTVQHVAERVDSETFVCVEDLGFDSLHIRAIIEGVLSNFPVMHARHGDKNILIDIHGVIMNEDVFLKLLNEENPLISDDKTHYEHLVEYGPRKKSGRKPLYEKYPKLVEIVTNFIKQHSFSAHGRRRETSGTGTGVTLQQIREHILQELPELNDISRGTVHYLMIPPRKGTVAAANYKCLVDARIPKTGRNDYRENHANQHFLFARVAYREEFCSKFSKECSFYSCDDMAKIRMGPVTAVSRYHQERRFFVKHDEPDLADHDTPHPGYLLNCSGYQKLIINNKKKDIVDEKYTADERNDFSGENGYILGDENGNEESDVPADNVFRDKLGRLHFNRFMAGPAKLVLRAVKFASSNAMHHVNDLLPLLKAEAEKGIGVVFLKVDNGGDWNLANLVNQVFFCRLWTASKLDVLGIVSYAARFSAYNNIEHLWAPMSKKLTSVILPSVLEGDDNAPHKLNLEQDEIRAKEAEVFDNATRMIVEKYWKDTTFNGSEVQVSSEKSLSKPAPYNDFAEIHDLLAGPYGAIIYHDKRLMKEMRFLFAHIEKKSNEVIFQKCYKPSCTHCTSEPIIAKEAWAALRARDFKWPNPVPSTEFPGHFKTFHEIEADQSPYRTGDRGLPNSLKVGDCALCNYMFMSVAERDKHLKSMHRDEGGNKRKIVVEQRCFFVIKENKCARRCNLLFQSSYELAAHKKQAGHIRGKKKKVDNSEPTDDATVAADDPEPTQSNDGSNDDVNFPEEDVGHPCTPHKIAEEKIDDNHCAKCQGEYLPGSGDWLLCSVCEMWYHESCF